MTNVINEWVEMVELYLNKKAVPAQQQKSEILVVGEG